MITLSDARRKLKYVNTDHIMGFDDDFGELDLSLGPNAKTGLCAPLWSQPFA